MNFPQKFSSLSTNNTQPLPPKANGFVDSQHDVVVTFADPNQLKPLSASTFEELNLAPALLKAVYAIGFQKPSKIQAKALPLLMAPPYRNFIGQSQSGSGKTAAFVLALLSRIQVQLEAPQGIVLAPTRELAQQIMEVMKQMAQFTQIQIGLATKDSVPRGIQMKEHVIVGAPGTVLDLMTRRRAIDPSHISMLVIDEADVMLDLQGMGDQTTRIQRCLPQTCQVVLFSATYKDEVRRFAERIVPGANMIQLKREELSVDAIKQLYLDCKSEEQKYQTLCDIYGLCNIGQSIIFCARKDTCDQVSARMVQDGHQVTVIHGGLEPQERDRIFNSYKTGETKVLITTNVLARGIDVLDINLVINYDLPLDCNRNPDYETYLHRIGRTGRFGRRGISINFVHNPETLSINQSFEKYFGKEIQRIGTDDIVQLEKELKEALKDRS